MTWPNPAPGCVTPVDRGPSLSPTGAESTINGDRGCVFLLELNSLYERGWIRTLGVGGPAGSPQELATEFWQPGEGAFGNPGARN